MAQNQQDYSAVHPLYYLLHNEPNPEMTSFVFRETLMSHLLLWGNAYAQVLRDGNGRVIGLYRLLPNKMRGNRDIRGNIYYIYTRDSDENSSLKGYGEYYLSTINEHKCFHVITKTYYSSF